MGLPAGVVDLWEHTGRRAEAKYTWDLSRNTNKEVTYSELVLLLTHITSEHISESKR